MFSGLVNIVARDASASSSTTNTTMYLLIAFLVLIIVALLAVTSLLYMRYRRRSQQTQELPVYNEKRSNHRRVTVRPSESIYVYQERQNLLDNSEAPPSASVPEIRITFPEEFDTAGKTQSGRVVVVHVGDKSLGLEPCSEQLPAYNQKESDRFQSLDLERIGGLKEKDIEARWS